MQEFRPSRLESLPPAVKNILIINVLLLIASAAIQAVKRIDIGDALALHAWGSPLWRPWQLLTHMFMHGNAGAGMEYFQGALFHLFSNMLGLWMFGAVLEKYWGTKRFLFFYFICGLGAAVAHLIVLNYNNGVLHTAIANFNLNPTWDMFHKLINTYIPDSPDINKYLDTWEQDPNNTQYAAKASTLLQMYEAENLNQGTVGASGAVFGILAAFAYYFPNTYLYLYFFFPVKAKWALAAYATYELYSGLQHSAGDNVAHFAHLGGFVVGLLIVFIWNKTNKKTFY